ncbi:DUF4124 domain-containing protein [Methylophaga lonarensis]|nr:DUF4124 domain-containing protein [Methylophaga lonarensis]
MKSAISLIFLMCSCVYAETAIYRSVDETGAVLFSDQQLPGAERVIVEVIPGYSPVPVPRDLFDATDETSDQFDDQLITDLSPDYILSIVNPVDDESVWINDGNVEVNVLIQPELQQQLGHMVQLTLNGRLVGAPVPTNNFVLQHLDRGSHELMATVIDEQGDVIASSETIVFHLHRATVQQQQQNQQQFAPQGITGFPTVPGFNAQPAAP